MIDLPINLKYVTIAAGKTQPMEKGDPVIDGYQIVDKLTGAIIASGTSLPDLLEYALSMDVRWERATQYVDRKMGADFSHLDDVDIDEEVQGGGLALPDYMTNPGGSGPLLN